MSSSTHLPMLFTIPPSNRHEFVLDTSAKTTLKALNKQITATIAQSPNCTEFMAKHKAQDGPAEQIQEFKMHWDMKHRDAKVWPEYTLLTDDNLGAIVEVLRGNPTMGVLEIKLGRDAE